MSKCPGCADPHTHTSTLCNECQEFEFLLRKSPQKEKTKPAPISFVKELTQLVNKHSLELNSNTPDFIIAEYLLACLNAWNVGLAKRNLWYTDIDEYKK